MLVGEIDVPHTRVHYSTLFNVHINSINLKLKHFPSAGGIPDIMYYTSRRYYSGIIGCISEIVLGGELKLSLDPETLGLAHNVEPGYF